MASKHASTLDDNHLIAGVYEADWSDYSVYKQALDTPLLRYLGNQECLQGDATS